MELTKEERAVLAIREKERKEKQEQCDVLQTAYAKYETYANLVSRQEQYSQALSTHQEGEPAHLALGEGSSQGIIHLF